LRNSRVSAVIPGLANPGQVAQALAWLDATIPSGFWTALAEQGLLHPEAPA
jgi:D-threo-aldose 1-dehydrogenase